MWICRRLQVKTATAPHSTASDSSRLLLLLVALGLAMASVRASALDPPQLFAVAVNGIAQRESVRAIESTSAGLLLSCADLQELQIRVDDSAQCFERDGERFVSVRSIPGLRAQVDSA